MASKRSRKGLWITLIVLAFIVVAAVAVYLVNKKERPVLVSVDRVGKRTITQTVSAIGRLQPEVMVKVSSEASGEIIFLGVRDGDDVKKGQLLARIQPDIVNTQLDQTRAAAESSKLQISIAQAEVQRTDADLKRITELHKKNFASKEELDRSTAAYEQAAGRYRAAQADYQRSIGALKQTQASASRTTIFSPIDGTVTYLAVEQGEKMVGTATMQGTEMMRISDLNTMNAWVDVDENDVALIQIGDTARIKVDALRDVVLRGVVYEIGHSAKVSAQGTQEEVVNFQVRIRILDKENRMRPGMSCNVEIETETKTNVVSVPIQAVTVRADAAVTQPDVRSNVQDRSSEARKQRIHPTSQVFVVAKNNSVHMRTVETGISDQGFIEVLSGLKVGDVIVTAPYQAVSKVLKEGSKIQIEDDAARQERFKKMRQ
ncbi:MAG: efflux RND transporter periplasmic adaptor subunit [Bacteroidetes bacterium]|nr:efflux RND transporter periplasmic adaptor subunit [Bacteroidota bacterium]